MKIVLLVAFIIIEIILGICTITTFYSALSSDYMDIRILGFGVGLLDILVIVLIGYLYDQIRKIYYAESDIGQTRTIESEGEDSA